MNILVDDAISAKYRVSLVTIQFRSGHTLGFPIQGNAKASEAQRNEIELSPFGLLWPALDEDLSFAGIMRGDYGQR